MVYLLAPDSFKDCLASVQVISSLLDGMKRADPSVRTILFPLADGGDGSTDVLNYHLSGRYEFIEVRDPLGRMIRSGYLRLNESETAVIELAKASGLELLQKHERDPLQTNTFGTGELIRNALDYGMRELILTIGGSATVDGGAGIASALGFGFHNKKGERFIPAGGTLIDIHAITDTGVHPGFHGANWLIASDVRNPLNGRDGAARVYGPQKGAGPAAVEKLAEGLEHLAGLLKKETGFDADDYPGTGAAGGAALFFLAYGKAEIRSGFEIIAGMTGFDEAVRRSDAIVTGEGSLDAQTMHGKVVSHVAGLARTYDKPVIAVAGRVEGDPDALISALGLHAVYSVASLAADADDSIRNAPRYLSQIGERIVNDHKS